jgi:hypothetical protein
MKLEGPRPGVEPNWCASVLVNAGKMASGAAQINSAERVGWPCRAAIEFLRGKVKPNA